MHSSGVKHYRKLLKLLLQDVLPFHRSNPTVSPWITRDQPYRFTVDNIMLDKGFSTSGIVFIMKSAKEILAKSPKLKQQVKATAALTRYQEKFLNAVTEILTNPDNTEAAFMARQLVQCTLPHKNPGNAAPTWRR